MALQHLRSNTASKRPTAGAMSDGQIAVNTNATSPGLFFKDAGGAIIKVGPVHVGTTAPNSSPAGSTGNSLGEQWLDTSGGGYVLKIWDGSAWRSEVGEFVDAAGDTMTGALILPSGTAAAPALGVGSTDNGLYSPGTDQVAISTNGTGRLIVRSNGDIEIPSTTQKFVNSNGVGAFSIGGGFPEFPLSVTGLNVLPRTTSLRALSIGSLSGQTGDLFNASSSSGVPLVRIEADGTISLRGGDYIRTTQAEDLRFGTNNTERLRITSTGLVGIGTSSPANTFVVFGPSSTGAGSGNNVAEFAGPSRTNGFQVFVSDTNNNCGVQTKNADAFLVNPYGGNVGIGTTSPDRKLHVNTDNAAAAKFGGTGAGDFAIEIGQLNAGGSPGFNATGGSSMLFGMGGSEAMRIDSSGRLLVGTSTSTDAGSALQVASTSFGVAQIFRTGAFGASLHIGSTGAGTLASPSALANGEAAGYVTFRGYDSATWRSGASIAAHADGQTWASGDCPTRLVFSTTADGASSPTERMRISNAGAVLINTDTTNVSSNERLTVNGISTFYRASGTAAYFKRTGNDGDVVGFFRDTTAVGSISVTTTATAYNTSSDYRLKENVTPVTDGITRLQQLKPSRFNFIADPSTVVDGFIAHEVQAIVPEAITGEKDAVDDKGNPEYQGIDQSKLVPLLTAALQEAITKIESLEARLTAAGI